MGDYTGTDLVETSTLVGRVLSAYTESLNNYSMCQRDHVYYGMTASLDSGWVDFHYTEQLAKIRLNVNAGGIFYDSSTGSDAGDFELYVHSMNPSNTPNINGTWLTWDQIAAMSWGSGTINLRAHIIAGTATRRLSAGQ